MGVVCRFSCLIAPPAEAKGPSFKKYFTPDSNLFELYYRIDNYFKVLGTKAGTKTAFGWFKITKLVLTENTQTGSILSHKASTLSRSVFSLGWGLKRMV